MSGHLWEFIGCKLAFSWIHNIEQGVTPDRLAFVAPASVGGHFDPAPLLCVAEHNIMGRVSRRAWNGAMCVLPAWL